MDPLTALGLAANIIQLVDYSTKVINGAREIYGSASGMTEEHRNLQSIVIQMKELSSKLLPTTGTPRSDEEKAVCRVAAECNIISDQIIELLGKIKPKNSKSKHQVALAVVKNKFREKERSELEKRLVNCRSQLELHLNVLTSSDTKARLKALVSTSDGAGVRLGQLQTHIEALQKGVTVTSISPEVQTQLQELLNFSEDACQTIVQQRILNSLAFEGMHGRFEAVDDAHYKTFEWIFEPAGGGDFGSDESDKINEDSDIDEGDDLRRSSSELFKHWLSLGRDTFHVSGKLGSGKSTLMKFLCEHDRTREGLQQWAGDRKLVFASFFFWKPGTLLQKSLSGLYRSLLHDVLKSCPELIPILLPDQWNEAKSMPWQVQTQLQLGTKDIKAAFSRLTENQNLYEKHCFCYFIDGLDEYEETRSEDYTEVVRILSDWTKKFRGNVKLCVSSREYNVFLNAFSSERKIRLQDLTRRDMERYVREKLQIDESEDFETLIQAIVDKGNGIFLWVALVVKTLRDRLEASHELLSLQSELDSLPDELGGLFTHLLQSLDKSARKRTYQLFAMTAEGNPHARSYLSPLACSFLENYCEDKTFAMIPDFPYYNMEAATRNERAVLAYKSINGYCRGLLEFKRNDPDDETPRLTFIHRSIPEFLSTTNIKDDMNLFLKDFIAVEAISQLLLAEIRSAAPHSIRRRKMSITVYRIVTMRHDSKIERQPFIFLEYLSSVITLHEVPEDPEALHFPGLLSLAESESWIIGFYLSGNSSRYITSPLLASAAFGDLEYAIWKMKHDKNVIGSDYQIAVLLCSIYLGQLKDISSKLFEPLDFLLQRGVSPQAMIHKSCATNALTNQDEMTFWVHFILNSLQVQRYNSYSEQRRAFGKTLETFFQHGADPRLSFLIHEGASEGHLIHAEYVGRRLKGRSINQEPKGNFHIHKDPYDFISQKGEKVSLRELIEFWDFENQEPILQLLDRNLEELERESRGEGRITMIEETVTSEDLGNQSELTNEILSESDLKKEEEIPVTLLSKSKVFGAWLEAIPWIHAIVFVLVIVVAILIACLLRTFSGGQLFKKVSHTL